MISWSRLWRRRPPAPRPDEVEEKPPPTFAECDAYREAVRDAVIELSRRTTRKPS